MIPLDVTNLHSYGLSLSLELVLLYPLFAYLKWNLLARLGMSLEERLLVGGSPRE